jgi:dTDP-glucose 4,6-dehydratase
LFPSAPHAPHASLITYVEDRPGHDLRYAIDPSRMRGELAWEPRVDFDTGLRSTVEWFVANSNWCTAVLDNAYAGERLRLVE